ncbi:MAG: 16S rRNA (guanine(966)-N(2))-methyltransferase RsmD [Peptococcaceae bacterium]|nr:16S rRNA (guanine(966)-N(2))-methyltransferase RsmD [Peptococcaceae bacterium]
MRVIAGELGGRRIKSVKGMETRPTADKVKGAVFNVLREKINDARVLDLFAGTGNMAVEAISRGAASAVLVEHHLPACRVIRENMKVMGIEQRVTVARMDVFLFLAQWKDQRFDLIFLDPPYHQGLVNQTLARMAPLAILSERGVIVAETGCNEELQPTGQFKICQTGRYGDTRIWYLQRWDLK